jgi:hypothetical protein
MDARRTPGRVGLRVERIGKGTDASIDSRTTVGRSTEPSLLISALLQGKSAARETLPDPPIPVMADALTASDVARFADAERVRRLAACKFSGPDYDDLIQTLVRHGLRVIEGWCRSGQIVARCRQKGVKGLPGSTDIERWSDQDIEELAHDTVASAINVFRRDALHGGGWRPDGGATLETYFIGACLYAFRDVYRPHAARRRRWAGSDIAAVQHAQQACVPDVAEDVVAQLVGRERATRLLDEITDDRFAPRGAAGCGRPNPR